MREKRTSRGLACVGNSFVGTNVLNYSNSGQTRQRLKCPLCCQSRTLPEGLLRGATQIQIVIRLLLCLASLAAFAATVCAQEPIASPSASPGDTNENIDWPSPDGKFAFLTAYGEDLHTIDLIDKKSEKKLQRIDEADFEPELLACALGARFESVRIDDKVGASGSRSRCLFPKRRNFSKDRIA